MKVYIAVRMYWGKETIEKVSTTKKALVAWLKSIGYYYSSKVGAYINDRTVGEDGGQGGDFRIEVHDVMRQKKSQ